VTSRIVAGQNTRKLEGDNSRVNQDRQGGEKERAGETERSQGELRRRIE
jgi:hypothetical protein